MIENILGAIIGGWTMIHFVCRARFVPPEKTTWYVKQAIALCGGAGALLFFSSIFNRDCVVPEMLVAFSLTLFDALLWYDGQKVSEIYDRMEIK